MYVYEFHLSEESENVKLTELHAEFEMRAKGEM
jgi:hypothetical protein